MQSLGKKHTRSNCNDWHETPNNLFKCLFQLEGIKDPPNMFSFLIQYYQCFENGSLLKDRLR